MQILQWIFASIIDFVSFLACIVMSVFSFKTSWGGKGKTPILFIHGYCNLGSVWLYHLRYCLEKDLGPLYTINLGYPFHSIERYGQKVIRKIEKIQKKTGAHKIILVGHSMGGLVASYVAMQKLPIEIQKVITLGTPFHGTKMAVIALGKCGKQMRYQSPFTEDLRKQMAAMSTSFYQIAAGQDKIVIPYDSAFTEKCDRQFLVKNRGHVSLLFSEEAAKQMVLWLKQ